MNDFISRQVAIDAFLTELTKRERKNLLHTWSTVEVKYFVAEMLEQLPAAQPERKKGEWWKLPDTGACDWYECSECGDTYLVDFNFCPGCGADMRGEQDD